MSFSSSCPPPSLPFTLDLHLSSSPALPFNILPAALAVEPKKEKNYFSVSTKNVLTSLIEPLMRAVGMCACVCVCVLLVDRGLRMLLILPDCKWSCLSHSLRSCVWCMCMSMCVCVFWGCYDKAADSLSFFFLYTICHQQTSHINWPESKHPTNQWLRHDCN